MNVPTVTIEDLKAFHEEHFTRPLAAAAAKQSQPREQHESSDLGFYPDGNLRTLTDEQIAMFRHTELQQLLKARRDARAAKEASGSRGEEAPAAVRKSPVKSRRKKPIAAGAFPKKPANEDGQAGKVEITPWNARKVARELDESVPEHIELDY